MNESEKSLETVAKDKENVKLLVENDLITDEWFQIISTDIEKQNEERMDCPLSEAYTNGMPKKYVKSNKLSNIVSLRETLRKAIKVVKLNDENAIQCVFDHISNDNDLENNFDECIKSILKEHINSRFDKSFNLQKFLHLNRYLFD